MQKYFLADLWGSSYLSEIYKPQSLLKTVKIWESGCFEKQLRLFFDIKGGYKVYCVKILIFVKLIGGWYLFEILHTSSTVKTSKNDVKSELF